MRIWVAFSEVRDTQVVTAEEQNQDPADVQTQDWARVPFDETAAQHYQDLWAQQTGAAVDYLDPLGIEFRLIPPGIYSMGNSPEQVNALARTLELDGYGDFEKFVAVSSVPQHEVRMTEPFYLGKYEVTVAQFQRFVDETGYRSTLERLQSPPFTWRTYAEGEGAEGRPVVGVSWEDATAFCRWLGRQRPLRYELPTEAQWEYACRAGSAGLWSFGDDLIEMSEYAVCEQDAEPIPAAIGTKRPNAFGLYDMHGNADEWCRDWHKVDFYGRSPRDNPVCLESATDPASGRVVRSGSWNHASWWTRSTTRSLRLPGSSGTSSRVSCGDCR